jgi:hypothetical protein
VNRVGVLVGMAGIGVGLGVGLLVMSRLNTVPHDPNAELLAALDHQNQRLAAVAADQGRAAAAAVVAGLQARQRTAESQPPAGAAGPQAPAPDPAVQAEVDRRVQRAKAVLGAVIADGGRWTEELRLELRDHIAQLPREERGPIIASVLAAINAGKIERPPGRPITHLFWK